MSKELFDCDKPTKDYYGGYTVASLYRLIREFSVVHKGMIKDTETECCLHIGHENFIL